MYEGFSGQARKAVELAEQEARHHQQEYVGTEHLLLGVLREGSPGVPGLLAACGLDPAAVIRSVEGSLGSGATGVTWATLPLTPSARRALQHAALEAARMQHPCVGPEHILLGVMCEEDTLAADVLQSLGATLPALRREAAKRPPENRDVLLRPEAAVGLAAARDPSPRDLEAVISADPLPAADSRAADSGITTHRPEERMPFPDVRWDSPVVERQLEALQVLVCGFGGGLIGAAWLGLMDVAWPRLLGAALGAFAGMLVGCLLIGLKNNFLARIVGLGAGMVCGGLYGGGHPVLLLVGVLLGGGIGLILGFCLGDWRKLMGDASRAPEAAAQKGKGGREKEREKVSESR
jgi:hypothetical protein